LDAGSSARRVPAVQPDRAEHRPRPAAGLRPGADPVLSHCAVSHRLSLRLWDRPLTNRRRPRHSRLSTLAQLLQTHLSPGLMTAPVDQDAAMTSPLSSVNPAPSGLAQGNTLIAFILLCTLAGIGVGLCKVGTALYA